MAWSAASMPIHSLAIPRTKDSSLNNALAQPHTSSTSPETANSESDKMPVKSQTIHFLTLPVEVRDLIWEQILDQVDVKRDRKWFQKPTIEFAALSLTCRQIFRELKAYKPQFVIPFERFNSFALDTRADLITSPGNVCRYRSLSIEFRHDASSQQYDLLLRALATCQKHLQELHLFFHGPDRYGTDTFVHGCSHATRYSRKKKLPLEGQNRTKMLQLQRVLGALFNLRVLGLSNLNIQLFPYVFRHKSQLEHLYLAADPRSVMHQAFSSSELQGLWSAAGDHPRVRVLQIGANTCITNYQLALGCTDSLEHLTWTVPDASRGWNVINVPAFNQLRSLIYMLGMHARNLKTLRLCVGKLGSHGHPQQFVDLDVALKNALFGMRSLKSLEVHAPRFCSELGQDILSFLPQDLERFYARDELILPRELYNFVTDKYFSASTAPPHSGTPLSPLEARLALWSPERPLPSCSHDFYPEHYEVDSDDEDDLKLWINPTTYHVGQHRENRDMLEREIRRKSEKKKGGSALFIPGIVGEVPRRRDYIPLNNGNLKFVIYEFHNPEYRCRTTGPGETMTQMVLRINGRLLDRDRNKHLASTIPGAAIVPQYAKSRTLVANEESLYHSQFDPPAAYADNIEVWQPEPLWVFKARMNELAASPLKDDHRYFGRETQASEVFRSEREAKPEDLSPPTDLYFVDEDHDEEDFKCQWLCPDPEVPTLAQLNKTRAGE